MKTKYVYIFSLALFFSLAGLLVTPAKAGVNLKNGNFYISYTDIVIPGPFKMEITRTYNSKSVEMNVLGFGWGCKYFTKMQISGDGSLLVREHGSGGKTRFDLMNEDPALIDRAVNEIAMAAMKNGDLSSPAEIMEMKNELRENADSRHAKWMKYFNLGLVSNPDHENGLRWNSKERGNQEIIRTDSGYLRISNNGEKELFDEKGNLIQFVTKSGVLYLNYDENDRLKLIKDSFGRKIEFTINEKGFIETATAYYPDGEVKTAIYRYDGSNLRYVRDAVGHEYAYSYDGYHNMTKIVYNPTRLKSIPEDAQHMKYYPETFYIKKITNRDGEEILYEYVSYFDEMGNKDDDHYATRTIKTDYYGDTIVNMYEYEIRTKENGDRYSYRITTDINGIVTQTTYNECCGLPIKISRNGRVTTFEYNNRGLITEKAREDEIIRMEYHPELDKMTYVSYYSPGYDEPYEWYRFQYDDQGNLTHAEDDTRWVTLHYNEKKKITQMESQDKILNFIYNEIGKPIQIEIDGVGAINITYDEWGEIKRVESEEGHSMALQVTQAFQDLLALVKPAGVNLNM